MADDEKTPYDTLLEDNANLKKEIENLRKEFNDLRDFNRALLSRSNSQVTEDKEDTKKKFDAYLKGE